MKLLSLLLFVSAFSQGALAKLSANPLVCKIPTSGSLCSSTISWSATGKDVKVKIQGMTFAAALSGSSVAPWISENPAEFELWVDGVKTETLTVLGSKGAAGKLSADPMVCNINEKTGLCSSTITWASTAQDVKVKIQGMTFAASVSGSSAAPWISENPAVFELWGDDVLLDTVTVKGVKAQPTPTPAPGPIDPQHCQATSSASLMACYQGVLQKTYTGIAILNDITCSGPNACFMLFENFKGPVKIYGRTASGKNAVIHRKDNFNYHLLFILNSTDMEIKDVDFQEGEVNKPAGLFKTPGYDRNLTCDVPQAECRTPITVNLESSRITFDHISILESKAQGIELGNVNDVTIKNSLIKHSWANGIWTTNAIDSIWFTHVPHNLIIENNTIIDNRCSGIELSAKGNSVVRKNYLSHNHNGSIYGHPGGQMAVEGNTTSLLIKDNEIANGRIDEDPVLAAQGWMTIALEFTDSGVKGVVVDHNYFHNNTGGGMIHDPNPHGPRLDFGPIDAINNVFNNPAPDFVNWDAGELRISNHCSGAQCVYVP